MVPKQQGYAIQVNDWPSRTNEREQHDHAPLMSQRSGRIDNDIQKCSRRLQGYTYAIQDSRHKPLVANNGNKINTPHIVEAPRQVDILESTKKTLK
jgi:hypothetical protein